MNASAPSRNANTLDETSGKIRMQPQRKFSYKKHSVEIDLKKVEDRWHWSYRIGNSSPYELNDTGESSEERALSYAFNDARGRIDAMA